jgi:hypothetical protein
MTASETSLLPVRPLKLLEDVHGYHGIDADSIAGQLNA